MQSLRDRLSSSPVTSQFGLRSDPPTNKFTPHLGAIFLGTLECSEFPSSTRMKLIFHSIHTRQKPWQQSCLKATWPWIYHHLFMAYLWLSLPPSVTPSALRAPMCVLHWRNTPCSVKKTDTIAHEVCTYRTPARLFSVWLQPGTDNTIKLSTMHIYFPKN